ncbi:hypothetical protein D9M71_526350 [compost metagenome]
MYTPQATPDRAISKALAKGGAAVPGNSSTSRPAKAISMPSSIRAVIRSPLYQANPNMVICTAPNSSNAPAPAPSCRYAAENRNAYRNRARPPRQLPPMASAGLRKRINSSRNSAPLARRTTVNDTGSMAPSFSASRQNTELAAKATRLNSAGQSQARALRSVSVVVPVLMV